MSKTITVEELAANLKEHLAEVRDGETLTITDEGRTIAFMEPPRHLEQRGVRYPFRNFDPGPRPEGLKSDPVELLIEDRQRDRSGIKFKP